MKCCNPTYFLLFFFLCSQSPSQTWQHFGLDGERIETIAIDKTNPNVIYAGSTSDFSAGKAGKLFKTTNGGITWDTLVKDITVRDIDFHPKNPNIVFVMGAANGLTVPRILKTTNAGQTWARSDSGISMSSSRGPSHLEYNINKPETLYAAISGIGGGGLYKSINGGLFWKIISGVADFQNGITTVAVDPINSNNVFVGTNFTAYLFSSNDNGNSWINRGSNEELINVIKFKGNKIYMGTSSPAVNKAGLYVSIDTFHNWKHLDIPFNATTHVEKLVILDDTLFLCGTENLYRVTKDSIVEKINLEGYRCAEVAVTNNYFFVGTENGILRKNIITQLNSFEVLIPSKTILYQNYPNPFNPTTEITYDISEPSHVLFEVFNTMGQRLERFVSNHSTAGTFSIIWNAQHLSGGTYFVRMRAGNYSSVKKMVLTK